MAGVLGKLSSPAQYWKEPSRSEHLARCCSRSRGQGKVKFCNSWKRGQEDGSSMVFHAVEQKTKDEKKRWSKGGKKSQNYHHQNLVHLSYFSKGCRKISALPGIIPLEHSLTRHYVLHLFFSRLGQCPFCFGTFWAACQSLLFHFMYLKRSD